MVSETWNYYEEHDLSNRTWPLPTLGRIIEKKAQDLQKKDFSSDLTSASKLLCDLERISLLAIISSSVKWVSWCRLLQEINWDDVEAD